MKKILSIAALAGIAALQSCKEKGVIINFGEKDYVDTTYVAAVETPQARNVLLEEFTGASCTNCPSGHAIVKSLAETYKDRFVAIAYHTYLPGGIFAPVRKPGEISAFDFRDSAATDLAKNIFNVDVIPKAGIDRATYSGKLLVERSVWASQTAARLAVPTKANLYLTAQYVDSQNLVKVHVKIAYTSDVSKKNVLTLGVIENDIIDLQEYPDSVDMHYNHSHIFRKALTPYYGNPVLDDQATKEKGRVYEYNYSFSPAEGWNLANCKLVGFLANYGDDYEVIQAAETKIE